MIMILRHENCESCRWAQTLRHAHVGMFVEYRAKHQWHSLVMWKVIAAVVQGDHAQFSDQAVGGFPRNALRHEC
jgi:hypothetical protein